MRASILLFIILFSVSTCFADSLEVLMQKKSSVVLKNLQIPVINTEKSVTLFLQKKLLPALKASQAIKPALVRKVGSGKSAIYRYTYTYKGYVIKDAVTTVAVKNNNIYRINNSLEAISVDTTSIISEHAAVSAARNIYKKASEKFWTKKYIVKHFGSYRLVYEIRFIPKALFDTRYFLIDAKSGEFLKSGTNTMFADNSAKVFETNPKRNPEPITVDLPWVDDEDGFLTSALDENNVRRIVATNCVDNGSTTTIPGYGEMAICAPTQLANKNDNGNFIYEDWQTILDYDFSVDDKYPEVSMYYHASKLYKYLLDLDIDGFSYLAGHRAESDEPHPLIVVANFQMPSSGGRLSPMDNAFYSPNQPGFADMFFSDFPYQGDLLVFGQGTKADFSADGDVIYHEFGHAVVESTAKLPMGAVLDKYGYSNVPIGMNEGFADTFSFIMTDDACLGEYVSEGLAALAGYEKYDDFYCMRRADNDHKNNENFTGESHHDGLPMVAANWKIYQAFLSAGFTVDDFTRIYLKSLISLPSRVKSFTPYAETFLSELENDDTLKSLVDNIEKIFTDNLFFEEIRARKISEDAISMFMTGGVGSDYGMPSSSFRAQLGDNEVEISPAYVELYYDLDECEDTVEITGYPRAYSQMGGSSASPSYRILMRKDKPIEYDIETYPVEVDFDSIIEPESSGLWKATNLEPGARYYFQFINSGGDGIILNLKGNGSWSSKEECSTDPVDPVDDTDIDDSDSDPIDTEAPDETITPESTKKDSGCSLIIL